MKLQCMPQYQESMERIDAWFRHQGTDRAPVQFNFLTPDIVRHALTPNPWPTQKDAWYDADWQAKNMVAMMEKARLVGDTFPIWFPNLGPNVYAAFYRGSLTFGEDTSWIDHPAQSLEDIRAYTLDMQNEYLQCIDRMTQTALKQCEGAFIVGLTDLHPGMDCMADWRGPQELCFDLYDHADTLMEMAGKSSEDFERIYMHFFKPLRSAGQPSVNWMRIPAQGKLHVPSCDFSALISVEVYDTLCMPLLKKEMESTTHNIYHLDGKDALRHLPTILAQEEIHAIQWQQGTGSYEDILQWVPVIQKIQAAGKGVLTHLKKHELEPFMRAVRPEGVFLSILDTVSQKEQEELLTRIEAWQS